MTLNEKTPHNGSTSAACPLCGKQTSGTLARAGETDIVLCGDCRVAFVSPMPDAAALRALYGEQYYSGDNDIGYSDYDSQAGAAAEWARFYWEERLNDIEKLAGGRRGRLLEIGCAYGVFLQAAAARGWRVDGAEISPHAAETAGRRLGINVFTGAIEAAPFANETYDLIAAFEVIEHIPEPRPFVKKALSLLKPGGLFVLTTPNDLFSFRAAIAGDKAKLVKLPEHVVFYSPSAVERLLTREGFRNASAITFEAKSLSAGKAAVEKRLGGLYRAARPLIRPAWRFAVNRLNLGDAIFCRAEKPK